MILWKGNTNSKNDRVNYINNLVLELINSEEEIIHKSVIANINLKNSVDLPNKFLNCQKPFADLVIYKYIYLRTYSI